MKCPLCQIDLPAEAMYCNICGGKLELECKKCSKINPLGSKFCLACGNRLPGKAAIGKIESLIDIERKQVTALFSDLSGYTAMTEKLDPENVREITKRIFDGIRVIVEKYEGFLERFAGDAVLALFGVPKAHEDDPIRAIRGAREICEFVKAISPEYELIVGAPLSMHSGINTGLAVTADVAPDKGTHGVTGEVINIAARLSDLAKACEIYVGPETYRRAAGYFIFETREPVKLKGKSELVPIYKLICSKERPTRVHSNSGFKAELIGRNAEMAQLQEGFERLKEGKTTIIAVCGDAGTGKSRLVEELKASFDLSKVRWREGNSYPFSQNIPYFPLIDLMNRAWRIEDGDPPEKIREKIESGIERLLGVKEDAAAYVGSLYSLSYPEIEEVSPEFWKARLFESIKSIVSSLTQYAPTIFCFEDIHWADPSTLDLLRFLLSEANYPVLFILVYRLPFSLFSSHQVNAFGNIYEEIRLRDLSASDTFALVQSLLRTDEIPPNLSKFIQKKAEGNPFYVEEAINALVEKGTLTHDNEKWILIRPIGETDIPPTVQGLISARLDRLEGEMKRLLQEASVIGRAFFLEILKRITKIQDTLDRSLHGLEMLDLVRVRSVQPDLEYIFKHALTQEVAYNGLLKKDRRELHERIGLVIEQLFSDRISEFHETLAFHFARGCSVLKAVDYLIKSGRKSLRRFALEEAHQYYREAFILLADKQEKSEDEKTMFIDILIDWSIVYYYQGNFGSIDELLSPHEELALSLEDKSRLGIFYAWLGWTNWGIERLGKSKKYLEEALEIGQRIDNPTIVGYACTWLAWVLLSLGRLDEALEFGQKAQRISQSIPSEHYVYWKSLGGIAMTFYLKGDCNQILQAGEALVDFGRKHGNIRSMVWGYGWIGLAHLVNGDFSVALKWFEKEVCEAKEPMYYIIGQLEKGIAYVENGEFDKARPLLEEFTNFCRENRWKWFETIGKIFLSIVWISQGSMNRGFELIHDCRRNCLEKGNKYYFAVSEYVLGKLYLNIALGEGNVSLSNMIRNIGFLAKNVPFAARKSEVHFNKAIEAAEDMGAKALVGMVCFDLGRLFKAKKRRNKASEYISKAMENFRSCQAEVRLKQAREELESLF